MSLRIQTNVAALNAHRNLTKSDAALGKSLERLSSGFRINHASDDAAGLYIANTFSREVKSLTVASRNITEATSLVQVAEGAMGEIEKILERMKELSIQAASDNVSDTQRAKIDNEFQSLESEIDRIANDTKYQGNNVIDGSYGDYIGSISDLTHGLVTSGITLNGAATGTYTITDTIGDSITLTNGSITETVTGVNCGAQTISFNALGVTLQLDTAYDDWDELDGVSFTVAAGTGGTFQVGSGNTVAQDRITFDISDMNANQLGSGAGSMISDVSLNSRANAQNAIQIIDDAIDDVSAGMADIGAVQNRLGFATSNIAVSIENFSASESVIRDVDMAAEMVNFTKQQILLQAGTAMLAQANLTPQVVLQLLS